VEGGTVGSTDGEAFLLKQKVITDSTSPSSDDASRLPSLKSDTQTRSLSVRWKKDFELEGASRLSSES
jgi:hypothetical protein